MIISDAFCDLRLYLMTHNKVSIFFFFFLVETSPLITGTDDDGNGLHHGIIAHFAGLARTSKAL